MNDNQRQAAEYAAADATQLALASQPSGPRHIDVPLLREREALFEEAACAPDIAFPDNLPVDGTGYDFDSRDREGGSEPWWSGKVAVPDVRPLFQEPQDPGYRREPPDLDQSDYEADGERMRAEQDDMDDQDLTQADIMANSWPVGQRFRPVDACDEEYEARHMSAGPDDGLPLIVIVQNTAEEDVSPEAFGPFEDEATRDTWLVIARKNMPKLMFILDRLTPPPDFEPTSSAARNV